MCFRCCGLLYVVIVAFVAVNVLMIISSGQAGATHHVIDLERVEPDLALLLHRHRHQAWPIIGGGVDAAERIERRADEVHCVVLGGREAACAFPHTSAHLVLGKRSLFRVENLINLGWCETATGQIAFACRC
jgi:hypothetical protein